MCPLCLYCVNCNDWNGDGGVRLRSVYGCGTRLKAVCANVFHFRTYTREHSALRAAGWSQGCWLYSTQGSNNRRVQIPSRGGGLACKICALPLCPLCTTFHAAAWIVNLMFTTSATVTRVWPLLAVTLPSSLQMCAALYCIVLA